MYLAGVVVGVAAFALHLPSWVAIAIAAASVIGGVLLATGWFAWWERHPAQPEPTPTPAAAAQPMASAIFRLEGEYWTIALAGPPFRLVDSKGLRYIHHLLSQPGVHVHALELVGSGRGERTRLADDDDLSSDGLTNQPMADEQALRAYLQRADNLREDIEEADGNNDPERASRARRELAALVDEIRKVRRPDGKPVNMPTPAERARINVTRTISGAVGKIRAKDASLGHHLHHNIHTGTYCWYEPDPGGAPDWAL